MALEWSNYKSGLISLYRLTVYYKSNTYFLPLFKKRNLSDKSVPLYKALLTKIGRKIE